MTATVCSANASEKVKIDVMRKILLGLISVMIVVSCDQSTKKREKVSAAIDTVGFTKTMERHLDAVANKDLSTLASTLSPTGEMQLILPGAEIVYSAKAFLDFHEEWFQDTTWTFDTKILNSRVGPQIGMAVVEVMYKEPERDGKPYFNRMIVSYDLKIDEGSWYIIKDHATSVEKSTDQ